MSYKTGFYEGRLGIGLGSTMGMGDGNPRYPLDINGDIRLTGSIVNGDGQVLSLTPAAVNWTIDDDDIFYTASGNVGIGTDNPGSKLHIHSTDNVANYAVPQVLITADPASSYNQWASLELRGSYIGNTVPYGVGIRSTYGWDSNNRYYGDFSIYTTDKDNGNARTNRLTVTSEGNVGIGTTSPGYALDVVGHLRVSNNIGIGDGYRLSWSNNNTSATFAAIDGGQNYLKFLTNGGYRMTIDSAGNVGIGTTDPFSKLNVAENGNCVLTIENAIGSNSLSSGRWIGQIQWRGRWSSSHPDSKLEFGAIKVNAVGGSGATGSYMSFHNSNGQERMRISDAGRVGIGTTSPGYALDVVGHLRVSNNIGIGDGYRLSWSNNNTSATFAAIDGGQNYLKFLTNGGYRMTIDSAGNVGIGTTSPHQSYKLDVYGNIRTMSGGIISTEQHAASPKQWTIVRYFQNGISNGGFCAIKDERNNANSPWGDGASFGIGEKRQANYYLGLSLRGYTCYANTSGLGNTTVSDNRIKKDIEDVPDNYALQKVRDLPCRYYNYKHEPKNSEHKVVGFIAQEVKQHLPGCINEGEMPVCMPTICEFVNVTWEKIGVDERDPSKNVFKIKCDEFEEYSNLTHRFYFSNDGSKNDENVLIRESSKEEDNSFIITEIDEPYDYVYVYGASQSDFLTIKKDQIFALHHSAIQEIDKQQQADKAKINELENKVSTLKSELAAIKQHLGI